MHTKAFPYIGILGFFWGTNLVAARFGVGEFEPFLFIALRLSLAAICFLPFMVTGGRAFPTDWDTWWRSMVSGTLGVAIPMSAFILSLQFMSSGLTSIFVTTAPALIALAAHFFLPEEKLNGVKWVGVGLALIGSIFLAALGESGLADVGRVNPLGPLMIALGMLSDTANTVFVRLRMRDMDVYHVTGIRLITGAALVTLVTVLFTTIDFSGITGRGYFSLLYATFIGAVGGQFMAFYITRRFGAVSFSLVSFVVPVVATFFGVILLGEIVTWGMLVGVGFIAGGLYFINN